MKLPKTKDLKSYLDFKIDKNTVCILVGGLFIVGLLLYLYFKDDKKDDDKKDDDKKDDDKKDDDNQIDIPIHDKVVVEVPDVKWPFLNLKDENNKNVNMLVIRGYLEHDGEYSKQFIDYLNQGIKFIGCSSHLSFPR